MLQIRFPYTTSGFKRIRMTNEQDIRELVDEQEEQVTVEASRRDF